MKDVDNRYIGSFEDNDEFTAKTHRVNAVDCSRRRYHFHSRPVDTDTVRSPRATIIRLIQAARAQRSACIGLRSGTEGPDDIKKSLHCIQFMLERLTCKLQS